MPASVTGREGKGIQSHFKVHFWGDLETGVTVNKIGRASCRERV